MPRKPDAAEIEATVKSLRTAVWLRKRYRRWPYFVHRHTDVRNAARILASGVIHCRRQALELGVIAIDSAHPTIIAQTPWAHEYVRLYFRPRSPTLWHVEGIRPAKRLQGIEQCVPVYLLFDALRTLTRRDTRFSRGSLARCADHETGDDNAFLRTLDFESVFHDGGLPKDPTERNRVRFAKQAEVLVPGQMGLEDLRAVFCRSGAERETLLWLLAEEGGDVEAWKPRIRTEEADDTLYFHDWAYVRDVRLMGAKLHVDLHPPASWHGGNREPFGDRMVVTDVHTGQAVLDETDEEFLMASGYSFELPRQYDRVTVSYEISGVLAYRNTLEQVGLVS